MTFKNLLSFSITSFIIAAFGVSAVVVSSIIETNEANVINAVDVDEVIAFFELENIDSIKTNEKNFLIYYNAVMKNKFLDKKAQTFYLNFFNYFADFSEYIDMNMITKNVSTFKLLNPEDLDEKTILNANNNNIAAKTIYDKTIRIEIYSYNDEDDYHRILTHESFHLFSNYGNWSLISDVYIKDDYFYTYDYLNPPLNISASELHQKIGWIFLEATTELLTNEYTSSPHYRVYKNEVLALKLLLEVIDPQILIKSFNKANGVVNLLNELNTISSSPHELLEIIKNVDNKTMNLIDNNIIDYYKYFEFLVTQAELKYGVPFENLSIELCGYIDQFKIALLNSNLDDSLKDLQNETQNSNFYLYLLDEHYLLNMHFEDLKNNKLKEISIEKRYFKSNGENHLRVIYVDSKTNELKEIYHLLDEKNDDTIVFYNSLIRSFPLNGFFLSIRSTKSIPSK